MSLGYVPRPQQVAIHRALEAHRWVVAVCHRRMGKTVAAVNHLIVKALESDRPRPRFGYIGPTYRQAKLIAWDYVKAYTAGIPGVEHRESDLVCNLPNGARVQLFGADNPDALRGLYFDGVVLDEYGLQSANIFSEVVRPALADRKGWALFLGTVNGQNQFYEMGQKAQQDETGQYAYLDFKASETAVLSEDELAEMRATMTADEYARELENAWDAAVKGAIFAKEMEEARTEQRIGVVPVEKIVPVDTTWDLGVGDSTSIWFSQTVKGEVRLVDYYEASGEGLPHYAQVLQQKGYVYGRHWAPHDIQVRELGSGRSRWETAKSLGITFQTVPKLSAGVQGEIEEGIHAARMLLARCWFDQKRCGPGIEALKHYRRDYNTRLEQFKATPVHDWASHGADAFRYLAVWHKPAAEKKAEVGYPRAFLTGSWMAG